MDVDVAFLAVPHTAAMQYAGALMERGIRTIDLSADYRLPRDIYEKVYGVEHTDYHTVPYGLPELHRKDIPGALFVANPGCFPTGATLAAAPLAKRAHTIIYDSKSGVTGAGVSPSVTNMYTSVGDNFTAYKLTAHRHVAEMRQEMAFLGSSASVHFTPHLLPVNRGILTTAHILLDDPVTQEEVDASMRGGITAVSTLCVSRDHPLPVSGAATSVMWQLKWRMAANVWSRSLQLTTW